MISKRFCLVDRSNMIVDGPCPRATDFECDWTPDRELVVVYSPELRPGDRIEVERGEEVIPIPTTVDYDESLIRAMTAES